MIESFFTHHIVSIALACSIALSSLAQVFQKLAANQANQDVGEWLRLLNPFFLISLACLTLGLVFWLLVLSVMPVSRAYPMLSLSNIIVMVLARIIFKEKIPWQRWIGAGFIMLGISVMMGAG